MIQEKIRVQELKTIQGWLLVYVILVTLGIVGSIASMVAYGADFILGVYLLVAFLGLLVMPSPFTWVRNFHIAFNLVGVGLSILSKIWAGALGSLIWVIYWYRSKRVKKTYYEKE